MNAFLIGSMLGFLIAIPPGPVSMTTLIRSTWVDRSHALALGLGAVVSETFYAGLGFFGTPLLAEAGLDLPLRCAGFVLVAWLGVRYALGHGPSTRTEVDAHPANSVALGFGLSFTTPTIGAAYMLAASFVRHEYWLEPSVVTNCLAAAGAGFGSFLWLLLLIVGGRAYLRVYGTRSIAVVVRCSGILLLLASAYLGFRLTGEFL